MTEEIKILLIDLSSVFFPIWHMSGDSTDVNASSTAAVAKVRALASAFDHVAICCDSGRSFRKDIDPEYKSNRPPHPAALIHQLERTQSTLIGDGFCVWACAGFEADDIIATAARAAACDVVIASSDKDLLQLVSDHVTVHSLTSGNQMDPAAVEAKLGVPPKAVADYLALVGDSSDNVKGAPGIGPKKAAALLRDHSHIEGIYYIIEHLGIEAEKMLGAAIYKSLTENRAQVETAYKLVALTHDAPIDFAEIFKPRVPTAPPKRIDMPNEDADDVIDGEPVPSPTEQQRAVAAEPMAATPPAAGAPPPDAPAAPPAAPPAAAPSTAMVIQGPWELQLEPRSLGQASSLASAIFESKLFSAYGTPQGVLTTIIAGRELGLGVMASLRGIHIIEGKPCLSAGLMTALVMRSGKVKVFTCIARSNESATVRAWRIGEDAPFDVTYTIDDARRAGLVKPKSGWEKNPADMCVARATAIAARLKFQDVVFGLYLPSEMGREDLEEAA